MRKEIKASLYKTIIRLRKYCRNLKNILLIEDCLDLPDLLVGYLIYMKQTEMNIRKCCEGVIKIQQELISEMRWKYSSGKSHMDFSNPKKEPDHEDKLLLSRN